MSSLFSNLFNDVANKSKNKNVKIPTINFDEFLPQTYIGATPKEFVMVEGWFLRSMFEELRKNPHNNYVTCMDNLIYANDFSYEDLDRTKTSCIVKKEPVANDHDLSSEIISSRIANIFNVKTQYVVPIKNSSDKCICIDFLQNNQTMDNYNEFTGVNFLSVFNFLNNDCPIREWLMYLVGAIKERTKTLPKEQSNLIINQVTKDFIKQYLFKKYIIRDADPGGFNYSFVHEKKDYSDLQLAPAYDFQYAFNNKTELRPDLYGLKEDIKYLTKNYYEILESIINDFGTPNFKEIKSIIDKYSPYAYQKESRFDMVKSGFECMRDYFIAEKRIIERNDPYSENSL